MPNFFSITLQFAAHASLPGKPSDEYYGVVATIDVYGYNISRGQQSASTVWVYNVGNWSKENYNSIRIGWMVNHALYLYKILSCVKFCISIVFKIPEIPL
jgi:hypothetical protein